MNSTITYYNNNADDYISTTINVDFAATQDKFLQYLRAGALILDFGCGSGRDSKYFLEKGFRVEATDGSEVMCRQAAEYTGLDVKQMYFQDLAAVDYYDGIWACSSILHLKKDELADVFCKIQAALKDGGILYTSFKYGDFEGERNGRYFTDFTEESFCSFATAYRQLRIMETWVTADIRPGRADEKWLNILMKKESL